MVYILPERLLALVRPAFDLVLRRIRSLKRCVQACGCKIETPRYAPQFGSRLHFKRANLCRAKKKQKKENKGSQKKGSPKKREKDRACSARLVRCPGTRGEWMFSGLPCESHIAHIAHIARNPGRVDVQWLAL